MHLHGSSCHDTHGPAGSPDPDQDADGASDPGTLVGLRDGTLTVLYAPDGNSRAGSTGAPGDGAAGDGAAATQSAAVATSPFVINITWDSSVSAAPAAFKTAVLSAAQYLESQFTDPATVNISVGYGEVDGTALGAGGLGASQSLLSTYDYGALTSALSADATSPTDRTAVASLPSAAPIAGTFWATTAEAKALGLSTSTTSTDGYVGFSSGTSWTYSDTAGVALGTYDFEAVAVHELTEVMGRLQLTGVTLAGFTNSYSLMDLFHYQAAGVRDVSASTPGYFSANSGATSLGAFNTVAGGDAGDWALSVANDSFDAFSSSGVINAISASDLSVMDVIGWNQAAGAAPAAAPGVASAGTATAGVSVAAATGDETSPGPTAGDTVHVAALTQSLGASTPAFVYGRIGNDILDGTGMTGRLFLAGGTGVDTMTGRSGANGYLFGSAADSTPNSPDTITNFDVGNDMIDLRGLGTKLTYAGQILAGAELGPHSIGWLRNGGNTLVYVDTTGGAQSLASASMEIKLTGLLAPTAANFAHV